ncbi:glucuronate isomerase [Zophobihabitans entericus]|uniref:Uronate isomerase n=1 Tax=Zophobihabitans entericus TaxID=1635327 RepID=A0A6G9I884_9GAMM|nr:glucuronate isomerase [Zophobihabitans entericus]QIQ20421.1 glucuronate isomerase [Zophobihabitans entericus]
MKNFLDDNFLLHSDAAQRLYFEYAQDQPIYDFHCHLPPKEIAENRQFRNLSEIWLAGDHYKWRVLRTAGIDENLITGDASDYEKYQAWAKIAPMTLGNPVYHWTHLELRRPFGIKNILFSEKTAEQIWHQANEKLSTPEFSTRGILKQMNVKAVGTTDDPVDSLEYHHQIAADTNFTTNVRPSWRPDKAFKIELPGFVDYLQALGLSANIHIDSFEKLTAALEKRLDHFEKHGCEASDHGIEVLRYADIPAEKVLDTILTKRLTNQPLNELEIAQFSTAVLVWMGHQYHTRHWAMQLHLGALRNNNQRMFAKLGPDAGFDSMGDRNFAEPLSRLLNALDVTNQLPKTIIYCLNPKDNEMIATMIGNFQSSDIPGKVQFGSGWWFNDQKDGMERQIMQLSQLGLLSQFVGMLTDSRSFLSFTRHEYFRRILCNMLGDWMTKGELPGDFDLVGKMVSDICYNNAKRYFTK